MSLIQLVYISTATQRHDEAALTKIMESASKKNEPDGLSGMLIYCDGNFMQVIEGEPEAVDATFARISNDLRHKEIVVVSRLPIDERSFGQWSMGFRAIDLPELLLWPAYAPFFDGRFSIASFGAQPSLALEMLKDFGHSDRVIHLD